MIIGIDFGTCYSSVAIMSGLIPVTNYINDPDKTGLPTLFMYSKDTQQERFAYECRGAEAAKHSADVIKNMKKIIRDNPKNLNMSVTSGDKKFTIKEVIEKYLTYLIVTAKEAAYNSGEVSNTNIEKVVIAAPVGIAKDQMTATDYNELIKNTIIKVAGISEKDVIVAQEPVVAAISYLYSDNIRQQYSKQQNILVFDLGGGTLDVTIVEHDPSNMTYDIKVKEGDLNLGGNDWDAALGNAILRSLGITGSFTNAEERASFEKSITDLKQKLTTTDEYLAAFKYNGEYKCMSCSRNEFDRITKPLLDRAITIVKQAISRYEGKKLSDIDKIVLVGGSCNMPQIKERMIAEFGSVIGRENIFVFEPSKAIAKGAAVLAKIAKADFKKIGSGNQAITVRDIATHTYGFKSHKKGEATDYIYNLIFKNEKYGSDNKISYHDRSNVFTAIDDKQKFVTFEIYESEYFTTDKSNRWMSLDTKVTANGMNVKIPVPTEYLNRATEYTCIPRMSLDASGILEFSIEDKNGKIVGYDKKKV